MKRITVLLVVLALALSLVIAGCARSSPAPGSASPGGLPKSLVSVSMPIGTSTYVVVSGLASVVEKYTGMKMIVQPLASIPIEIDQLNKGKVDIINLVLGESYAILRGLEPYAEGGPKPLRQLGAGDQSVYFWVSRPDTGIKTVQDMVGKKVAYISAITQITTDLYETHLKWAGVLDKVTSLPRESMDSAARALIEKRVDVIGGPHGSFAYSVQNATGIILIPMGADYVKWLAVNRPDFGASVDTIKAGWFGLDKDYDTMTRARANFVRPDMSDDAAYAIVKAIYDHPEDTKAIHSSVGDYNLNKALRYGFLVPVHPGAIRYYKEKGIWTKEHEALQQKYLDEEKQVMAKKK